MAGARILEDAHAQPMLFARLRRALRRQDWVAVVLEVTIVVVGVVIGFQVTAWGAGRADAAKEQVYLRQLEGDLRETLAATEQALERQKAVSGSVGRAIRAYRTPERPPLDSLQRWIRGGYNFSAPTPVLGTAQGIVSSGDLSILRNDSLRAALPAYIERSREQRQAIQVSVDLYASSFAQALQQVDIVEIGLADQPPASIDSLASADAAYPAPAGERRTPFPVTTAELLDDRALYTSLATALVMSGALLEYQAGVLEGASGMLRLVEAAQDESAD